MRRASCVKSSPRRREVSITEASAAHAFAPGQVRLPAESFLAMTAGRRVLSASLLVRSTPGIVRKVKR